MERVRRGNLRHALEPPATHNRRRVSRERAPTLSLPLEHRLVAARQGVFLVRVRSRASADRTRCDYGAMALDAVAHVATPWNLFRKRKANFAAADRSVPR